MEERVRRRIRSHAAMVKPCLNSAIGPVVEIEEEGERSTVAAAAAANRSMADKNAGGGFDRLVRRSSRDDKPDSHHSAAALNPSSISQQASMNPAPEARQGPMDSDSETCEGPVNSNSEPGLMNPAMAHEAAGSSRRSVDWPVEDDCIFCKIVHGYAPAFKLYEDEYCLCILDINPLCYGHSLLVPKGHFPALDVTPPPVAAAMCSVVPLLANVIMEATSCDAFNMVVNNGEAAGQVVFHTHFHIVPRFSGDGLWTNESVVRKSLATFKDPTQLTHAVRSKLRSRTC